MYSECRVAIDFLSVQYDTQSTGIINLTLSVLSDTAYLRNVQINKSHMIHTSRRFLSNAILGINNVSTVSLVWEENGFATHVGNVK